MPIIMIVETFSLMDRMQLECWFVI